MSTNLPATVGMNQDGTKELKNIFDNKKVFNFPKPSSLVKYLIEASICKKETAIILDSFAGSGTTAHAVLSINKENNKNHRFITVELGDYAEQITAERIKRVIKGYSYTTKKKNTETNITIIVEGTGGDFSFYELGEPLLIEDKLNSNVDIKSIKEYVYYTETNSHYEENKDDPNLLGIKNDVAYYFFFDKKKAVTLNHILLNQIKVKTQSYVIYADLCTLSHSELAEYHFTFKKNSKRHI